MLLLKVLLPMADASTTHCRLVVLVLWCDSAIGVHRALCSFCFAISRKKNIRFSPLRKIDRLRLAWCREQGNVRIQLRVELSAVKVPDPVNFHTRCLYVNRRKYKVHGTLGCFGHQCGGRIISRRWILSAGHSTQNFILVVQIWRSLSVHKQIGNDGIIYLLDRTVNHPAHGQILLRNDISLLQTIERIQFNEDVQAISFGRHADPYFRFVFGESHYFIFMNTAMSRSWCSSLPLSELCDQELVFRKSLIACNFQSVWKSCNYISNIVSDVTVAL